METFSIAMDAVPTALRWHKDELWAWDAKGKQILVLRRKDKVFELDQSASLPAGAQSLLLTYRADEKKVQHLELWTLSPEASGESALKKFLVRR